MKELLQKFIRLESFSGGLLVLSTFLALGLANSTWREEYQHFLTSTITLSLYHSHISISFLHFVNDGLMVVFFMLIGLEIKREMLEGNLSQLSELLLPLVAALGGIAFPAFIFFFFNHHDSNNMKGWAIPTATDIAFALGVLALLGSRIPIGLRLFVMAVAIYDDIAAILIIAVFYTGNLSTSSLLLAMLCIIALIACNQANVKQGSVYLGIGCLLWMLVLNSGVHATLAGVILAFTIPLKLPGSNLSPLKKLEERLHAWVGFLILPLFAFANAGIYFDQITKNDYVSSLTLGIGIGLFIGKQLGIFTASFIVIKFKLASLPKNTNWLQFYGGIVLCGIGFTMSLFIAMLAFEDASQEIINSRLGIFIGSLLSVFLGSLILLVRHRS